MKATRRLNIKDWSGCLFYNMTNINDFDKRLLFVNDFKECKDGSAIFNTSYCEENNVPYCF